jgi:TolB protein
VKCLLEKVITMRRPARRTAASMGVAALVSLLATCWPAASGQAGFPGANGRIVFQRESVAGDHTQVDLFTVRPDGLGLRRLTATPDVNELGPAWSARGGRIAFWRTRAPFGPGSVWVMNADGSGRRRLTGAVDARDPAWNPAGTRLVYQQDFDLFTLRSRDGTGRRQLTSGAALDFEPAWAPGGRRIAFTRGFVTGDAGDLYLFDRPTGTVRRVTHSPAYDHQVAWAPRGRWLVFERDFGLSSSAIFVVRPDGTGLRRLTTGQHFDTSPAWSPNGRRVVLGSDRGTTLPDLWVMRADGTALRRLLRLPGSADSAPDWQPVH